MKSMKDMPDIEFDLGSIPKATHCNQCGKELSSNSIFYINGEGFCNSVCETRYDNYYRYGCQIQECIEQNIPPLFLDTDISKLPQYNLEKIKEILNWEYNRIGIFLWGDSGSGKTRTLLKLTKSLIEDSLFGVCDKTLACYNSGSLKSKFEDSYAKKKSDAFLKYNQNVDLIVIDDFGKERFSEGYESFLFNVIDYRTSHRLPSLISTNFSGDALKNKFTCEENFIPFARRIKEFFRMYKFINR